MTSLLRRLLLIVGLLMTLIISPFVTAQGQSPARGPKINRHFVPAGKPETWPANDWVPITAERLQLLIDQQGRPVSKPIVIEEARLHAVFDPQRTALVDGRAVIAFPSSVPTDRLVSLSPLNVAIRKTHWTRATLSERPVVMGFDDAQQLQIAVPPDAGELQFDWLLAGTSRLNGVEFDLRLPRAIVSEVWIDTPSDWTLSAGTVLLKAEPQAKGLVRWLINPGTMTNLKLLLSPESLKGRDYATSNSLRYRQTTTLQLSRGRLDERLDYVLDTHSIIPENWQLALPSDWRCDAVMINGRTLLVSEWALKPLPKRPAQSAAEQLLTVPLTAQNLASAPTISVRISRTLPANQHQAIGICLAPRYERTVMLSGQLEVQIASSLSLIRYDERGLRQTELQSDENVERLLFQQDKSNAQLELFWADQTDLLQLKSRQFLTIDLDDNPASFRADLEIEPQSGSVFDVAIGLPRFWEVSEVVLAHGSTSNRRVDWTVVSADSNQQLKLSFPDGLPANNATVIRINGHYVGASKSTEIPVPIGILKRGAPESLLVALSSRTANSALIAANNRFSTATSETLIAAQSWSALAKVTVNPNVRLWSANGLDPATDLQDVRIRQVPVDAASALPVTKPTAVKDPTTQQVQPPKADGSKFRPVFSATLRSTLSPGRASRDQHELALKLLCPTEEGLLQFRLPPQAQLQHVEWHGQRVAATSVGTKLSVALQAPKPDDLLQIHYTLPAEALFLRETYQVDLPSFAVPIDGLEWEVRLPTRYVVVSYPGDFVMGRQPMRTHWLAWLFGPLARRRGDAVFNPFNANAWMPLFMGDEFDQDGTAYSENGWRSSVVRAPRLPESLAIEVCDRLRLSATAWLILVSTVCIGVLMRAWQTQRRNLVGIIWLTVAVALTVMIPASYAELIGATILGSVIACLVPRSFIRRTSKPSNGGILGDRHFAPTVTVQQGIVSVLLAAVSWQALTAQDAATNLAPVESIDLLIEYEGDRFAPPLKTGLICIPANTLNQLVKNVPQSAFPSRVLFHSAQYDGDWTANGLSNLKAHWTLWLQTAPLVNRPATAQERDVDEVSLPVPLRLFVDGRSCRVNGQSVELIPNADGQSVRVLIPRHKQGLSNPPSDPPLPEDRIIPLSESWRLVTIDTDLRPTVIRGVQEIGWQVQVPRTLHSDVVIEQRDQVVARPLFSRGWVSAATPGSNAGSFIPVSELRVIQTRPELIAERPLVSVAMKSFIEPGAENVRRATLVHYSVSRGEVRQVAWKLPVDAVIPIERVTGPSLRALQVKRTPTETWLLIEFNAPQSVDFQLVIPWSQPERWQEAPQSIAWEAPTATPSNQEEIVVASHVAAMAPIGGFNCRPVANAPTSLGNDAEANFMSEWPSAAGIRSPQLVWSVPNSANPQWKLTPIASEKAVRWRAMVEVDRDKIEWLFAGEVDVAGAPAFMHVVDVDPRLVIESVNVTQDEVNRLAYWTRQENRLYLHLRDRVTGPQTIRISARESDRNHDAFALPKVELLNAKVADTFWQIVRNRSMSVELLGADFTEPTVAEGLDEVVSPELVDLGTYRVRHATELSFVARPLPAVSHSWGIGSVDRTELLPSVEMVFHVEPGSLERTVLTLPRWPVKSEATIELDGDPAARLTSVPDTLGSWNIELGKNNDMHLQVRLKVVLDDTDDMLTVELPAPTFDGVSIQTMGFVDLQRRSDSEVRPMLAETHREAMLAKGIISPTWGDVPLLDWKQVPLDIARTSLAADRWSKLPMLVQHEIWLGHRDRTSARTTALAIAKPEGVKLHWSSDIELQAVLVNHIPQSVQRSDTGELIITMGESNTLCLIELLWSRKEPFRALRIGQWHLEGPHFHDVKFIERMAVGIADARRAFPIDPTVMSSEDWDAAIKNWSLEMSAMPSSRMLARTAPVEMFPRDSFKSVLATFESRVESPGSSALVIERLTNATARFWVIDERLDQVMLACVIALLVAPIVRILIQFRSGDWLAQHPPVALALLSGIWWLCLLGSGFGLAVLSGAITVAVIGWLRRKSSQEAVSGKLGIAMSSRSRHTF